MKINVLDHGFVKLLNVSGPIRRVQALKANEDLTLDYGFDARDIDPAIAARISFDNFEEERTYEQDMKLVEYLMAHNHTSPIEFIETWWEIKLPIFVARQFHRHRTKSINEQSGRYSTLAEEWYIPDNVGGKSKSNKQGQEDNLQDWQKENFREALDGQCRQSYKLYKYYLSLGVAPEHARLFLHVNHYTHYVFKMNLHNLMHFLSLRLDKHAQIEARAFAEAMYEILKQVLPGLMELFDKYRRIEN